MYFWQNVADQYSFSTKKYEEKKDPSFFHRFYTDEILSFPLRTICSKYEKLKKQSYIFVLPYIFNSTNTFHDFPVTINVFYYNQTGRQCAYFSHGHQFICLFNNSDLFKMHMHNAWLLESSKLDFELPKDFFDSPLKLFLFCRNVKITDLVETDDIASFDAPTYLMIDDKYMVAILNSSYMSSLKETNTILPCLFSLLTLEMGLPLSLQWFESKFPNYDKDYIDGIKYMVYAEFLRRMLNFASHNKCFERHFYIDFLGRTYCRKTCPICIKKDQLVQDKVTKCLESCIDLDSNSTLQRIWILNMTHDYLSQTTITNAVVYGVHVYILFQT